MRWLIRQYRGWRIWWATLWGRPISVKWFGADETGQKDSMQAFQRAINYASKERKGSNRQI